MSTTAFNPDLAGDIWRSNIAAVMDLLVSEDGRWVPADQATAIASQGLLYDLRRYGAVNVRLHGRRIDAYSATILGIAWWTR